MVRGVRGRDDERRLGAHTLNQVDRAGVDETLVLVGIVLVTDGNPRQRRTLLTEVCDDLTSVDTRDGGHTLAGTPLTQALDRRPMAVLEGNICHDDTGTLDMGRLEILEEVELVTLVGGDSVVADKRLGEDEDLTAVRGIGHGLGVSHEGGGEDGFTRNVGVGAESGAVEDGAVLEERNAWSASKPST